MKIIKYLKHYKLFYFCSQGGEMHAPFEGEI